MNPRIERLRELLEEPLLVTNPTNILYLFGFKSSNAALLVEQDRARLFTDFRYSEAARAVEGVEFEETKRALLADLAGRLSGRIGFEADFVSCAGYETLRGRSIEPVPRRGLVERLRAVKDDDELGAIKRACEITDRVFERLVEERFVGRSERDLARRHVRPRARSRTRPRGARSAAALHRIDGHPGRRQRGDGRARDLSGGAGRDQDRGQRGRHRRRRSEPHWIPQRPDHRRIATLPAWPRP